MISYITDFHEAVYKTPSKYPKKIYKLCRLIDKLLKQKNIVYDDSDVQVFEMVCGYLHHAEGEWAHQPFVLDREQKWIVAMLLGIKEYSTRYRRYLRYFRELVLLVARKWGKSLFVSALIIYFLAFDDEYGAQVYCTATNKKQARIIWNNAERHVRESELAETFQVRSYENEKRIFCDDMNSFFAYLSKGAGKDGFNPHCYAIDEMHEITDKNTYSVMSTAVGNRLQPMGLLISSAGITPDSLRDSIYGDCEIVLNQKTLTGRRLPVIFEIDPDDDPDDESCWIKANPGMDSDRPSIEYLREEYQKALRDHTLMPGFLSKNLNRPATATMIYLELEDVKAGRTAIRQEDYFDMYAIGGVDLAETTDLCCATALIPFDGGTKFRFIQQYFIARERLERNSKKDRMTYRSFEKTDSEDPVCSHLLKVCDGSWVRHEDVTAWFVELRDRYNVTFIKIGYDPWHADAWVDGMEKENFYQEKVKFLDKVAERDDGVLSIVRQKPQVYSPAIKELKTLFEDRKIFYDKHNALFAYCCSNLRVSIDRSNCVQPEKAKSTGHIDGFMSLVDAYVCYTTVTEHFQRYQ